MAAGVPELAICLTAFGLSALALCLRALLRLRRWRKARRPGAAGCRKALLPLLAAAVLTGCLAVLAWGGRPVPAQQLLQHTGRTARVERHSAPAPFGGPAVSSYFLELEDGERLYIPQTYPFDTAEFLAAAGRKPAVFRYARIHGRNQVFEIQAAGGLYLSYEACRAGAWQATGLALAELAVLLLWLAGPALGVPPAWEREGDELPIERSERRRRFARQLTLTAAGIAALILLGGFFRPQTAETPACTALPLTRQVTLELNGAWQEYGVSESGIQWYRIQEGASTCFHAYALRTPEEEGLSPRVWAESYLTSQRDSLCKDFIAAPDPAFGPFLEQLRPAPAGEGVDALWSEGMAKSSGGSWNHFLLVLLPEQGCMLMIHSSSWSMGPEELAEYAAAWVREIPGGLRLRESF